MPLHSRWNFCHFSQWIFFATLSCIFRYWFFARLGKALIICVTLSIFSLQSLQSGVSLVLLILYFTKLVRIACPCAQQRRLLVSLFSSPFLHHSRFLLSLWHSVSPTDCSCSVFAFPFFNRFSFFSFLFTLRMYFFNVCSTAAFLTRASLLCVTYFDRLYFSLSTQPSTLTRPLPLSLHHITSSITSYIVIGFLVFLSNC